MKRLLTLLALVLCSCAETFVGEKIARPNNENLPDLTASFAEEDATRIYIENGKYLRWNENDRLTVFFGNTLNRQYKFNGKTGDNSGTFSLVPSGELGTGNAFDSIYALYPYNESARISDEGVILLTLPATQLYAENSFGKDANTMIAVTENVEDTFLAFKNACGYLKLKLYDPDGGGLKSVTIKGNNNEKIAGAATATIAFGEAPVVTLLEDATDSITLDCGDGILLGTTAETATELWIVLPETIFTKGITIIATDVDGGTFEKSTSNEVVISRNTIQPMAALEVECKETIPNNEIWYTSSDGNIINPMYTDVFGANIISNTFENGKGIILFDADVTSLGDWAFSSCHNLTSITLPNSIITLGYSPFQDCKNIKEFNGKYAADGGRCLIKDNAIIAYASASGTEYTIPDGVTVIAARSFWWNDNLTSIIIPNSIISIEESAFYRCINLTSLSIPDSVTTIGGGAFAWCLNLEKITLPNGIKEISSSLFNQCEKLTEVTIPDNVVAIQSGAFYNCKSLTNIIIPDNVSEIKLRAFCGCESLLSITIPDSVMTIGDQAFEFCDSLKIVDIGSNVASLGNWVFRGCLNIERFTGKYAADGGRCLIKDNEIIAYANASGNEYTIPKGVVTIAWDSFFRCNNLTNIIIPDSVTTIGSGAFASCTGLTSVIIPDKVTTIEESAFEYCKNLKTITIGESVETIGDYAFYYCSSLTSVYCRAVTPPTGSWDMFYNNASGRKIYVPTESVEAYKSAEGWCDYADVIVGYDF